MDTLNNPIRIIQQNISGLNNHIPFLKDSLYREQTDIAILQETLYERDHLEFSGYQLYRTPYKRGGPRGLVTLVKNTIPSSKITQSD